MANAQKIPYLRSLNQFAERKIQEAMEQLGQSLPASVVAVSNSIVTVKFEINSGSLQLPQVTCPVIGSEYIRLPLQVGTKGMVISADYYLGGMSGLGGGVADLSLQANLSALVFVPIGNKLWTPTDDPNAVVIYGPDGVVLRTVSSETYMSLKDSSGIVVFLLAGQPFTINGDLRVNGKIHSTSEVIAGFGGGDQVGLQTHLHGGVSVGGGSTAAPTAGT